MKITAFHVKDFKRISEIAIEPTEHSLLLIGGDNGQGKSSTLDALTFAFGGPKQMPLEPVRRGADAAEIRVELDDGALVIRRTVKPGAKPTLEVTVDGMSIRSPQDRLDRIIGERFLDPLAFLALPASAPPGKNSQRATLLGLIPEARRIAHLDAQRAVYFEKRTDVGRDLRKAEGALASAPAMVDVAAPIDVSAVAAQVNDANAMLRQHVAAEAKVTAAGRAGRDAKALVDDLRAKLAKAEEALQVTIEDYNAAVAARRALPDADTTRAELAELTTKLAAADAHNTARATAAAANARRRELDAEVTKADRSYTELTEKIDAIDLEKRELLEKATLPVEGLGVDETGVTLAGIPLAQASGAERLRVALALAIAASPHLADIWIRDGALLDDTSLALVAEHARAAGVRVWVERVGARDEGAIVIHDGGIVGAS